MSQERLVSQVLLATPTGKLVWSQKLSETAENRVVFSVFLGLLPQRLYQVEKRA